jgi:hypothetical protein
MSENRHKILETRIKYEYNKKYKEKTNEKIY